MDDLDHDIRAQPRREPVVAMRGVQQQSIAVAAEKNGGRWWVVGERWSRGREMDSAEVAGWLKGCQELEMERTCLGRWARPNVGLEALAGERCKQRRVSSDPCQQVFNQESFSVILGDDCRLDLKNRRRKT